MLTLQDNHTQIQNMGHIYERATVTIVAVAGERAEDELLGVNLVSRLSQPSAVVGRYELVSTFRSLCRLLEDSKMVH